MKTTIRGVMQVADHTVISLIIAAQFLGSLFFLLASFWIFGYGGAARPYLFLLWLAYWCAGIATAVFLQEKGRSWFSPPMPPPRRRVPALLWNAGLVTYLTMSHSVHWPESTAVVGYFSTGATAYLAFTSTILWYRKSAAAEEPIAKS